MSHYELIVLGAGPGGYSAAFRAADLGMKVALIERQQNLGGICLNVGCIPSKAFLHSAKLLREVNEARAIGLDFGTPEIHTQKLAQWKNSVVKKLTAGLASLAKQRKVARICDHAEFKDAHTLRLLQAERSVSFDQIIIACGSRPASIPNVEADNRLIWNSTGALKMECVPSSLLVIGGGIIGMELAQVYHALGSQIDVVELSDQLVAELDRDLAKFLLQRARADYRDIFLNAAVSEVRAESAGCVATFTQENGESLTRPYERVLLATGRVCNSDHLNLQATDVQTDAMGYIQVNDSMATHQPHIYAIGDAVGQPMLAHKAVHQGKVAAECAAGKPTAMNARVIPSVAYTDPEVAWVGLTEQQAHERGLSIEVGTFPWQACGRALAQHASSGMTKILANAQSKRIVGGGCAGRGAGELIAEIALAIEMQADCEDVGLTVHPHPTLSETTAMACEAISGSLTDLIPLKRKK